MSSEIACILAHEDVDLKIEVVEEKQYNYKICEVIRISGQATMPSIAFFKAIHSEIHLPPL